jgi:hypothetical protein
MVNLSEALCSPRNFFSLSDWYIWRNYPFSNSNLLVIDLRLSPYLTYRWLFVAIERFLIAKHPTLKIVVVGDILANINNRLAYVHSSLRYEMLILSCDCRDLELSAGVSTPCIVLKASSADHAFIEDLCLSLSNYHELTLAKRGAHPSRIDFGDIQSFFELLVALDSASLKAG